MSRPDVDVATPVAIFAGGAMGALARAGLHEALPAGPGEWPWATFAANVAGAALLGWAAARLMARRDLWRAAYPFLGVGLCGALTTFSTFQLELLEMLDAGRAGLAVGYAGASLAAGLAAATITTGRLRRGAA
jgi:CrcB protein